jgi:hypothetical protein
METKTWERCLPIVRRYQRRLLGRRILREPDPVQERWVIVLTIGNARPLKWFRYCPNEVWRWTGAEHTAEIFRSYDKADQAAKSCSLYYQSHYQIRQIS